MWCTESDTLYFKILVKVTIMPVVNCAWLVHLIHTPQQLVQPFKYIIFQQNCCHCFDELIIRIQGGSSPVLFINYLSLGFRGENWHHLNPRITNEEKCSLLVGRFLLSSFCSCLFPGSIWSWSCHKSLFINCIS